jgi:hypothetical protein
MGREFMVAGRSDAERAQHVALLAEPARLLAERDRLRDELADRLADFGDSPEEIARQLEQQARPADQDWDAAVSFAMSEV